MRIIARLLPLALALTVLTACHRAPSAMKPGDLPQYSASSAAEPTPTPEPSPEPTPTPTPTPEPTVAPAMAAATANDTKDAPQITDPATWNRRRYDAGRAGGVPLLFGGKP